MYTPNNIASGYQNKKYFKMKEVDENCCDYFSAHLSESD